MTKENYWDKKIIIDASAGEKLNMLNYEIWMFRETYKKLGVPKSSRFEKNLLVESIAVHARILINFFYPEEVKKVPNDITAEDFIKDWKSIKPEITQTLVDAKNKADKQLAHLSTWRIKIEKDGKKGWGSKIFVDLEKVIQKFVENLPRHQ